MKKRILSFFCACLLLFAALSSLGTFATEPESEEEPTVEELVELAKEAEWCGTSFWGAGAFHLFLLARNNPDAPELKWAKEEGLMTETFEEKSAKELYGINLHTGNMVALGTAYENMPAAAFPKEVTVESLKKLYLQYFAYDLHGIFTCPVEGEHDMEKCFSTSFLTDSEGRLYSTPNAYEDTSFTEKGSEEDFWSSARITEQTENRIQMTLYGVNPEENFWTVEFRKTVDGWRISGGTYFPPAVIPTPPETGDNTPIFLTLTALSVLGICALAVTVGKRKRRR